MKTPTFQLISETFLISNFPQRAIDNQHFKSVINKFGAKISHIEDIGEGLVCLYLTIEKEQSQNVIEWLKENYQTLKGINTWSSRFFCNGKIISTFRLGQLSPAGLSR